MKNEYKAGRMLSQKNVETIQGAIDGIHEKMETMVASIKTHTQTLTDLLDEYGVSNDNNNKTRPDPKVTKLIADLRRELSRMRIGR
jgi:hypothetical protein